MLFLPLYATGAILKVWRLERNRTEIRCSPLLRVAIWFVLVSEIPFIIYYKQACEKYSSHQAHTYCSISIRK